MSKHECLFAEGTAEYWMPIQEPLLPDLQKEAVNGSVVDLFIRWLGANRDTQEIDWVFWISNFRILR
ncbi:MAG: hypothetical protein K8S20_11935 [Chloroflexi bacterium]|nr:hypothetical protein [Chloroflexota bacterium]